MDAAALDADDASTAREGARVRGAGAGRASAYRLLATLHHDARVTLRTRRTAPKIYRTTLAGVGCGRVESTLEEHQRATDADGIGAPRVIEHNVVAASKIFKNIKLDALGALLEVEPQHAEKLAANMIASSRLSGTIDPIDGILEFDATGSSGGSGSGGTGEGVGVGGGSGGGTAGGGGGGGGGSAEVLRAWDERIVGLYTAMDACLENIASRVSFWTKM